ncbi:unnamed protein product, partial [Sphagnum balticum]
ELIVEGGECNAESLQRRERKSELQVELILADLAEDKAIVGVRFIVSVGLHAYEDEVFDGGLLDPPAEV